MRNAPAGGCGRRLFWGLMFGLPAIFVVSGILMIAAGFVQTPRDSRLPWAGAFVIVAGTIGLLAAGSFRRRALRGEPY